MKHSIKEHVAAAAMGTALLLGAALSPAAAQAQVYVQVAPPPPRYEVVPPPRRGMVWAPGHWEWRGNRHVWANGVWLRERPGYAYRAPDWREHDGRWELRRGGWDRDGDGVPNRYDRRPDNPNRR